jgi:hypothetical protein
MTGCTTGQSNPKPGPAHALAARHRRWSSNPNRKAWRADGKGQAFRRTREKFERILKRPPEPRVPNPNPNLNLTFPRRTIQFRLRLGLRLGLRLRLRSGIRSGLTVGRRRASLAKSPGAALHPIPNDAAAEEPPGGCLRVSCIGGDGMVLVAWSGPAHCRDNGCRAGSGELKPRRGIP